MITALFCDVAGSTAMAEQLDPEEWAEIMNEAFPYLTRPIDRYGGTVARLMGDAALAFFGAPTAHEDDPQRAVLAALDIVEGIAPFRERLRKEYGLDFNVRVGVNTGPVVVGDVGDTVAMEYTAMGDAVNVAARMEQTAQPGSVQVSGDTYRLVAPLFDVEPLGTIEVKGKGDPVPAYHVLGVKAQPGRLRGIDGVSAPLVGRNREFGQLKEALEQVREGHGRIMCLIGEAGLGKSRLLEEARAEWLRHSPPDTWEQVQGSPFDTSRPYGLFQRFAREMFQIDLNDPPEVIHQKVDTGLRASGGSEEAIALCSVALERIIAAKVLHQNAQEFPAEVIKDDIYQIVYPAWRASAARAPVVMAFDDLHWADQASVELAIHLMALVDEVPILFLCAFRPERQSPAWQVKLKAETDYPHRYTEIALQPLDAEQTDTLVRALLNIADLPQALRLLILRKTEGNPYFVEEVVRSLIEQGVVYQTEDGLRWKSEVRVEDISIPDTLQGLLIARMDRLDRETRETLQLASVIGRSFYHRILKAISDSTMELDKHLVALQRVELVREAARIPELEYIFKHELARDAAYNSILHRRRRQLHRQVGEAMETLFSDGLEANAHRLAQHFEAAGENEKALKYYLMAGAAAAALFANADAAAHYARAIGAGRSNGASLQELLPLYTKRGRALELVASYDEAMEAYSELGSLGLERGDRHTELEALLHQATLCAIFIKGFDPARGRTLAQRALALARGLGDSRAEAKALWNLMLVSSNEADMAAATQYGEQAMAINRREHLREDLAYVLNDIALPYFVTGRTDEAWAAVTEATALWRELGNLPMLADSLNATADAHHYLGEYDEALRYAREAMETARSTANFAGQSRSLFAQALVALDRGEVDDTLRHLEEAYTLGTRANFIYAEMAVPLSLSACHGLLGDSAGAAHHAEIAAANATRVGHRLFQLTAQVLGHYYGGRLDEARAELEALSAEVVGAGAAAYPDPVLHEGIWEIGLALGAHEAVLAATGQVLPLMRKARLLRLVAPLLYVRGRVLLATGDKDGAREHLEEARSIAEQIGSKMSLWPVLAALAQMHEESGDSAGAEARRQRARDVIMFVADHVGASELRDSFLGRPEVLAVLRQPTG